MNWRLVEASSDVNFLWNEERTLAAGDYAEEGRNFSDLLVVAPNASFVPNAQEFPQLSLLRASFERPQ